MGRWATRTIRGGGTPPPTNMLRITQVTLNGTQAIDITFSSAVAAANFHPAKFKTTPSNATAFSVIQNGTNTVTASYGPDIDADTALVYSDTVAGIFTPETVTFT